MNHLKTELENKALRREHERSAAQKRRQNEAQRKQRSLASLLFGL